jgi:hypothetical protein
MRSIADGAIIQLRDETGRMVAAVQAAQKLATSAEADRLLTDGIGDDLPAQPFWVEARGTETGPGGADTAAMVRRFAAALVTEFGGLVWEPESSLVRNDPLLTGTTDHPAITLDTGRVAVAVQDRPVVSLSNWLVDAIATHGHAGRGFQLVTPAATRLTHAMRSALENPMARWVVKAAEGQYFDGFSGLPLSWHEEAGFVRDPSADASRIHHSSFRGTDEAWGSQLLVDVKVLHPAEDDLRLGGTAELVSEVLGGDVPALWGTSEPAPLAWDTADLTALARTRAPGSSWFVFTGPPEGLPTGGTRPFSGTLLVSRVPEGVLESLTLAVGYPPGTDADLSVLPELVGELAARGVLQMITVHRRTGREDLTYEPRRAAPALPVGLGIGAEGIASIGTDRALSAPVPGIPFGPPLTPAVWYQVGEGTELDDRTRLGSLMGHLRSERVRAMD